MTARRSRLVMGAASVALALGLAGCAGQPAIQAADASAFRGQVVSIAQLAQAGDLAGAVTALDQLDALVTAAVAAERLDPAREAEIRAAMASVREDLDAEIARIAEQAPEPEPAPAEDDGDDDGGDDGDDGPGKGKGKGKGKGGDD